jgi:hypothetical protein
MLIILFILIGLLAGMTYAYYRHQNDTQSIGGKISPAKSYWLGFVLFHYFIYPIYYYFWVQDETLEILLVFIAGWFYLRMFFQGIMMFGSHNWTPKVGIAHNLITAFLLMICQTGITIYYFGHITTTIVLVSSYILTLIAISLTDTLYAHRFNKIVGDATQGKEAVWFASNVRQFEPLNKLTTQNNYLFTTVSFLIIIIMYYDKY